jgi:ubiquinone/menaquinone biosynthesis C-methylase UbiE
MTTLELQRDAATLAADQALYFDMLAEMGHTKHIGGLAATKRLMELVNPREKDYILDVGCGVGIAPVFLAWQYGCRVVGVDITPRMLVRARERAERKGVTASTDFRVADMHALPFEDGYFDAVIAESVICFSSNKEQVLAEMIRVVKPGGHVAFTEATWRILPPPEMAQQMAHALGLPEGMLQHEAWRALLENSELEQLVAEEYPITFREEAKNQYNRIDISDYLRTFGRFLKVLVNPAYRAIYREALASPPASYYNFVGYGVYGGIKP